MDAYKAIIDKAVAYGNAFDGSMDAKVTKTVDKMFVLFGVEILKVVPGRVSTEVTNSNFAVIFCAPLTRDHVLKLACIFRLTPGCPLTRMLKLKRPRP